LKKKEYGEKSGYILVVNWGEEGGMGYPRFCDIEYFI